MKTVEATLDMLEQNSVAGCLSALDLFYLIGSFPNGITYEDLKRIWPNNSLEEFITLFERLNLLDTGAPRKTLNRFLTKFVHNSNFHNLKETLMTLLCQQYTELL